jgi:3-oxoacid CoA-transferase subunit A
MVIMAGGFGLCGIPEALIHALRDSGVGGLTVILQQRRHRRGRARAGCWKQGRSRKMVSSYVGENRLFAQQYLGGELELEFNPQGTLAERIRAGGAASRPFSRDGRRHDHRRGKDVRQFDGEDYVMERGLVADLSLVHAWKGDTGRQPRYRKTARNFNPMMASAGRVTVAEVKSWSNRARSTLTTSSPRASTCSASCTCRTRRSTSSSAPVRKRAEAAVRPGAGEEI